MSIKVSHCVPTDPLEIARIHYEVFSKPPVYQTIYGGADPTAVLQKFEKRFHGEFQQQSHVSPDREKHFLKAANTSGDIMAYITWNLLPHGFGFTHIPDIDASHFPPGCNVALAEAFARILARISTEHEGRRGPHYCRLLRQSSPCLHSVQSQSPVNNTDKACQ